MNFTFTIIVYMVFENKDFCVAQKNVMLIKFDIKLLKTYIQKQNTTFLHQYR